MRIVRLPRERIGYLTLRGDVPLPLRAVPLFLEWPNPPRTRTAAQ